MQDFELQREKKEEGVTSKEKELAKNYRKEVSELQARMAVEKDNLVELDRKIAAAELELQKNKEQLEEFLPAEKAGLLKAIALDTGAILDILRTDRANIAARIKKQEVEAAHETP